MRRPTKNQVIVSLIALVFVGSGPLGIILASGGRKYRDLLQSRTTKAEIRRRLGEPIFKVTYEKPFKLKDSPQIIQATKANMGDSPFVWGTEETYLNIDDTLVQSCEIYENEGPYAEPNRAEGYGMIYAMTLSLGGPIVIWEAMHEWIYLRYKKFNLTFWYDVNDHYVGYFQGNVISDSNKLRIIKPDPTILEIFESVKRTPNGFIHYKADVDISKLIPKYITPEKTGFLFEPQFEKALFISTGTFDSYEVLEVRRVSKDGKYIASCNVRLDGIIKGGRKSPVIPKQLYGVENFIVTFLAEHKERISLK